ncbi:LysR family transcriptional regulator [Lacrimispora saccharolytica]|uniref:Transcriptional regulator, LysR family n=1 Tax=Lacrimispora saccharolytica (strain ATCC 35040 / DSM 2544 / NRCC 2533 / WM1) TaxID=610130 RepID=D9R9R8_LACSW|nr:LysR family transcriptional regulator [Lacrimispora saccharolytica]ADL04118.1 transcriptional regulator, LysR family [[Clostridium] saccharolyticum WM1]QRV21591.1 LysR family transcriptional regulator [Lacrimispora saccharolytica]
MNIHNLKMFIKIVESGSISKTAEEMNISQSALSQQLRVMEQEFSARLFERNYQGVIPTNIGMIVYNRALEILSSYDRMLADITNAQNQNKTLHILASPCVYSYALPCTVYHVKNKYPEYTLNMEMMSSRIIEEKISKGFADMGIIIGRPKDKNLSARKVFSDRVFLVAGEKMKVPSQLNCQDLSHYPLLMLVKTQKTRQVLDKMLSKNGIRINQLHIPYTLDSTESIKLSAINGFGLAFLPYMAIKKEIYNKQLRIIECHCLEFDNDYYSIKNAASVPLNYESSKLIKYIETILKETIC